jgi:sirohydrochlorin cobaltochelatase
MRLRAESGNAGNPRLVLFAHGSSDPRWRETFENLTVELQKALGEDRVRLAYMQSVPPTLFHIAHESARDGINHLRVLPLFLSGGGHVAQDIPELVASVKTKLPQLEIDVLPAIGEDPRILGIIKTMSNDALGR